MGKVLVELDDVATFDDWQPYARFLLNNNYSPDQVHWQSDGTQDLFNQPNQSQCLTLETINNQKLPVSKVLRVNKAFIPLAKYSSCHSSPDRFAVLYRLLWRLVHEDNLLLANASDSDVHQVNKWAKAVGRDRHKMKAFVRFKKVTLYEKNEDRSNLPSELYMAWFEPSHSIVKLTVDFFVDRFSNMDWSILTPYLCAHWISKSLFFTPGTKKENVPDYDPLDDQWRAYYISIFNPARLKVKAMCSEMPKKYWHNLPEGELIKPLIQQAELAKQSMLSNTPTDASLPDRTKYDRKAWLAKKTGAYIQQTIDD